MNTATNTTHRAHSAAVEFKKGRRLHLSLVPLGFLFVVFLWAVYVSKDPSDYERAQGYAYLFFELPLLNCIVMPIMISVIASRLCDMEIKGQTLKLLCTLQKKGSFYDLKFLHEVFYLLIFVLGEALIFPFCGTLFRFTETFSLSLLVRHVTATFAAGAAVLILQHLLSLCQKNQILPLIVGLAGSFLGLFSMFFPHAVARLILWGYFGAFLPYSMNYDDVSRQMSFIFVPLPVGLFVGFLLFSVLFYLVCRCIFLRREV